MEKSEEVKLLAELASLTGKVVKDIDHKPGYSDLQVNFTDGSWLDINGIGCGDSSSIEVVSNVDWVEYANLVRVKELLRESTLIDDEPVTLARDSIAVVPILHNQHTIILQLDGWSINLNSDGTWLWEATDGG